MEERKWNTRWNRTKSPGLKCGPGRTKQSFRQEADINFIVSRYEKTGMLVDPSVVRRRQALFGDFSEVGDFLACQEKILKGHEAFSTLSSSVRERFHNDPAEMLDFMSDEANRDEAVRLGIVEKKAEPVVVPEVVTPAVVAPVAPVVDRDTGKTPSTK